MNRRTRDKFASGTKQVDLTTGNACWETPPAVFAKLNADFGPFDVDLTADAQRALCPQWIGPGSPHGGIWASPVDGTNTLTAPWLAFGNRGYSNPPYGAFVPKLLKKAKHECAYGFTSVLLLPMRATKAFREHILHGASDLLFCDTRIVFWEDGAPRINPRTGRPDGALFDSIVVIYRRTPVRGGEWSDGPKVGVWEVPRLPRKKRSSKKQHAKP